MGGFMVLTNEQVLQRMQELLADLKNTIDVMNDLAIENRIERVEFMGQYIHFGTVFIADYVRGPDGHYDWSDRKFVPAAKGPVINEDYWSASSFNCYPSLPAREWMFGDDPLKWRKTDHEMEADTESERWPSPLDSVETAAKAKP